MSVVDSEQRRLYTWAINDRRSCPLLRVETVAVEMNAAGFGGACRMRTIVKKPLTQITSKSMILAGVLPLCVPAK